MWFYLWITIIPKEDYEIFNKYFMDKVEDVGDIAYLSVAKASNADGIWTHDSDFQRQDEIKIFSNIDLLRISRKSEFE